MDIKEYSTRYLHYYSEEIPVLLKKYLDNNAWGSYAELGCGDGSLLYALSRNGYFKDKEVYAVDISDDRIDAAKKIDVSVKCFKDDVCNLKNIADNSVDFLVSKQVIEHVKEESCMVREINRIIRKDGTAYFSTVFKKKFAWYFYRCNGRWALDPTHVREYVDEGPLLSLFAKYGFRVVESKKTLFWFPLTDFIFKRIGFGRDVYRHGFWRFLRNLKLPVPGYYDWELVFKK